MPSTSHLRSPTVNVLGVAPLVLFGVIGMAPATVPPDSAPPNDPELEQLLLTVDDMPPGWAVETSGDFTSSDDEDDSESDACEDRYIPTFEDASVYPTATVVFTTGGGGLFDLNFLVEVIVDVGDSDDATGLVEGAAQVVTECSSDDEGNFSEMSFPDLGDATTALVVSSPEIEGFTLSAAVVLIAVEERVVFLLGFGDGAEGELLADVATTAVENLG